MPNTHEHRLIKTAQDLIRINDYGVKYVWYHDLDLDPDLVKEYKKKYKINTNCAKECIVCQIAQIDKYADHREVKKGESPFQIDCDFIPKTYELDAKTKAFFPPEDHIKIQALKDPVLWAKYYLGVVARKHQEIDLRCSAKRKVARWGRRSGKTFGSAVQILYYTLTTQIQLGFNNKGEAITAGPTTMVLAPYLNQIQLVFGMIDDLLRRNPDLLALRTRYVKTPHYQMEFGSSANNRKGAQIVGFTTSSSSSSDATSIRGQGAHKIYLDEVDFMNETDYNAILPILHEDENRTCLASSTPKGSRARFWTWCQSSPDWKEFHFPSTVLDNWDKVEKSVKSEANSEAQILQEYMADFISQDVGVYQPQYVALARSNPMYEYTDYQHAPTDIISIGVDWNSTAGTEICVIAMDKRHHFWLVEALNIPNQGWTQLAAVEAVVDANKRWRPRFLYVDAGAGATNIELLRAYSLQQRVSNPGDPTCNIYDILKAYEFGSKLEIADPVTGERIKKPAKDFMVQNSIRCFEEGTIHIPYNEELLHKQLLNYIIDKVRPDGQRVYGLDNPACGDHRLDAFNLALVAYKLEMSDFAIDANLVTTVRYGGIPGENFRSAQVSKNIPFSMHVRYPERYMEYNIDRNVKDRSQPGDRSLSNKHSKEKSYTGGKIAHMRPGFMDDTEHLYKKPQQSIAKVGRGGVARGSIRRSNI